MKKFNPEKELNKVQYGDRKKLIGIIVFLLAIIAVGSTYALYQVRHTKSLVYTTVSDFKKRDIYLSVLVDGKTQGDFPKSNEGKIYSGIECDKPYSEAYFDNTEWKLHFTSDGPNKCTVKFETGNLPNAPELYQGMIPIVYGDNGLMYVADTSKDWYNYQDHRWANAVLVDESNTTIKNKYFKEDNTLRDDIAGNQVLMEEVLQMYVWIPRYKYQLFNAKAGETTEKQLINIKFEEGISNTGDITCKYTNNNDGTITESCLNKEGEEANNGEWYTHPAFTFKGTFEESGTELKGIWVGKFEPSDPTEPTGRFSSSIGEITILPNKSSLVSKATNVFFESTRLIETSEKYNLLESEIDTHPMKNIDWGAVAYLSQSVYGIYKDGKTCGVDKTEFDECRIWPNNTTQGTNLSGGTATGCVADSLTASTEYNSEDRAPAKCADGRRWNQNGVKASTTGNIYGIYDMNGGASDRMMATIVDSTGQFSSTGSGSIPIDTPSKYYDLYTYDTKDNTIGRSYLGDAVREVNIGRQRSFNGSPLTFLYENYDTSLNRTWLTRGGFQNNPSTTSIFESGRHYGGGIWGIGFRVVLTAQDGND